MSDEWSFLPRDADALLVVPPFFTPYSPGYGAELLVACGRKSGLVVASVYANLSLASMTGLDHFEDLLRGDEQLWGERLFSRAAFGLPGLGRGADRIPGDYRVHRSSGLRLETVSASRVRMLEPLIDPWVDRTTEAIAALAPRAVGFSVHEQSVSASYALAARIKKRRPKTMTLFGGPACAGSMAEGILSLGPAVDVVFAGDADIGLTEFLQRVRRGTAPRRIVVPGDVDVDLDALPLPDFDSFLEQVSRFLPEVPRDKLCLLYECCRGCWRAPHSQCAFCGFAPRSRTQTKRHDVILDDLATLGSRYPRMRVAMTDPCLHPAHLSSVVPALTTAARPDSLAWAVRPDLAFDDVVHLHAGGVEVITVGIESLSTTVLARFHKGITARDAVATLRYARSVGLLAMWNLLAEAPGQLAGEYREMSRLVPLLAHLQPPFAVLKTEIVRSSSYFNHPEEHGLSAIQPIAACYDVFPTSADIERLASRFVAKGLGEVPTHEKNLTRLLRLVDKWSDAWTRSQGRLPELSVRALSCGAEGCPTPPFLLTDTRGLPGLARTSLLTREEAAVALSDRSPRTEALETWALNARLGVLIDGQYTPLATGSAEVLRWAERLGCPNDGRRLPLSRQSTSETQGRP